MQKKSHRSFTTQDLFLDTGLDVEETRAAATLPSSKANQTPRSLLQKPTQIQSPPATCHIRNRVWEKVVNWVNYHLSTRSNVLLPDFGRIWTRTYNPGIAIPIFEPSRSFLEKYQLSIDSTSTQRPPKTIQEDTLNLDLIAQEASVDSAKCQSAYVATIRDIGEAIRDFESVEIFVGAGTLRSSDGVIFQNLIQSSTTEGPTTSLKAAEQRQKSPGKKSLSTLPRTTLQYSFSPKSPSRPANNESKPLRKSPRKKRVEGSKDSSHRHSILASTLQQHLAAEKSLNSTETAAFLEDAGYPTLIDVHSRTMGAELVECKTFIQHVTDRIGTNYSPGTLNLCIDADVSHELGVREATIEVATDTCSSLPVILGNEDQPSASAVMTTKPFRKDPCAFDSKEHLQLYKYYIEHGVADDVVAELKQSCTDNVSKLLPTDESLKLNSTARDEILSKNMHQMLKGYKTSIKKSILDYFLLRKETQERLSLPGVPTVYREKYDYGWGRSKPLAIEVTTGWKMRKMKATGEIERTLMTVDAHILVLQFLWKDYDTLLMVDLPTSNDEAMVKSYRALDLASFVAAQRKQISTVKKKIMNDWYLKCKKLLNEAKKEHILPAALENPRHYFDCIAALMSTQLRGLVERSIKAFVAFFDRFTQDAGKNVEKVPGLLIPLKINDGKIEFSQDTETICRSILELIEEIATSFKDINRIETLFEPSLDCGSGCLLWNVGANEVEFTEASKRISSIIRESMNRMHALEASFSQYCEILNGNLDVEKLILSQADNDVEDYRTQVKRYYDLANNISATVRDSTIVTVFLADCTEVKSVLVTTANNLSQRLLEGFAEATELLNSDIRQRYKVIAGKLSKKPADLHALVDSEAFYHELTSSLLGTLNEDVGRVKEQVKYLCDIGNWCISSRSAIAFSVPSQLFISTRKTIEWSERIKKLMIDAKVMLGFERTRIENSFIARRSRFQTELEELESEVTAFHKKSDVRHATTYAGQLENLRSNIEDACATIEIIGNDEEKLGWIATDFFQINTISEYLDPYIKLWTSTRNFRESHMKWLRTNLHEMDIKAIEAEVSNMYNQIGAAIKALNEVSPAAAAVGETMKAHIESFRKNTALIAAVTNSNLRDRHWKEVRNITGFSLHPEELVTLQRLLDMNVLSHAKELCRISEFATLESRIEDSLVSMKKEWSTREFLFRKHGKRTFVFIETSIDEIRGILDSHITKTKKIRCSRASSPFYTDISRWEKTTSTLLSITELLDEVGKAWLYIQPILTNDSLVNRVPQEREAFMLVDDRWRDIVASIVARPLCMEVLHIPNIIPELRECRSELQKVEKGLNSCLEYVRSLFPRFYFLGNKQLVQAFSAGKNPTKLSSLFSSCYNGIKEADCNKDDEIVAVISPQGERLALSCKVPTKAIALENWLSTLDRNISVTLQSTIEQCYKDYVSSTVDVAKWVKSWPQQALLAVQFIAWTGSIEESICRSGNGQADAYDCINLKINAEIDSLRSGFSESLGETLTYQAYVALIQAGIRSRDVTTAIQKASVRKREDWIWQSQLRSTLQGSSITIDIAESSIDYGYEYLGNTERLIVTPTTHRCYRALALAMENYTIGTLHGACGSGKTYMISSLASICAYPLIIQSAQQTSSLDVIRMTLKGALMSGAWYCLDNLSQFDSNAMSFITESCRNILEAKAKSELSVILSGDKVVLNPKLAIFSTQAGYSTEEDNHCSNDLFRCIAVANYDLSHLAQVLLYSFGFISALDLAKKLSCVFNVCASRGMLTLGLHSMTSVIKRAVSLKRKFPDLTDEELVCRALKHVVYPEVLMHDKKQFNQILFDLFPKSAKDDQSNPGESFTEELLSTCQALGIQGNEEFLSNIKALYDSMSSQFGIILSGPSYSGKSSMISTLAQTLTRYHHFKKHPTKLDGIEKLTTYQVINPLTVSYNQLYGMPQSSSNFSDEGIIARMLRSRDCDTRTLIVFDSNIESYWAEGLCSLLDDRRYFSLSSGEKVFQGDFETSVIFEVDDLASASPSIISKCGVVSASKNAITWTMLTTCWLENEFPDFFSEIDGARKSLVDLFNLLPLVIDFIDNSPYFGCKIRSSLSISSLSLIENMLKLLGSSLNASISQINGHSVKQIITVVECAFLQAVVHGIGCTDDIQARVSFEQFLINLRDRATTENLIEKPFHLFYPVTPSSSANTGTVVTVYDYVLVIKWGIKWKLAKEVYDEVPINDTSISNSIVVPTNSFALNMILLSQLQRRNILIVGAKDTGKSVLMREYFRTFKDRSESSAQCLTVRSLTSTSVSKLQEQLLMKISRRGKCVLGPEGGKQAILFIDDFNTGKNENNASEGIMIEWFRYVVDRKQFFGGKKAQLFQLEDLRLIAGFRPRKNVSRLTQRFTRHWAILGMVEPAVEVVATILNANFESYASSVDLTNDLLYCMQPISLASAELLKQCCQRFGDSSFLFSHRDLLTVIKGIIAVQCADSKLEENKKEADLLSSTADWANTPKQAKLIRAWFHETSRVFGDQLESTEKDSFNEIQLSIVAKTLKATAESVFLAKSFTALSPVQRIRKLSFWYSIKDDTPTLSKDYKEIKNYSAMEKAVQRLNEHVMKNNDTAINTLFLEDCMLVMPVCRIASQENNRHLYIYGPQVVGRKDLIKIALGLSSYESHNILELDSRNLWRQKMKEIVLKCAVKAEKTAVLIRECTAENICSFFHDIGELVSVLQPETWLDGNESAFEGNWILNISFSDIVKLSSQFCPKSLQSTSSTAELVKIFWGNVRKRLRIIILRNENASDSKISPLYLYPDTFKCFSIQRIESPSEEALLQIADFHLKPLNLPDETRVLKAKLFVDIFICAKRVAEAETRMYYPSKFIDHLKLFAQHQQQYMDSVQQEVQRFSVSQNVIQVAKDSVNPLRATVSEGHPRLKESIKAYSDALANYNTEKQMVQRRTMELQREGEILEKKKMSIIQIKEECDLQSATTSQKAEGLTSQMISITRSSVLEMLYQKAFHPAVEYVFELIGILFRVIPGKGPNGELHYFSPAKELIEDPGFIEDIRDFDVNEIPETVYSQLNSYINSSEISWDSLNVELESKGIPKAALLLGQWTIAVINLAACLRRTGPKLEQLKAEKVEYQEAEEAYLKEKTKLETNVEELQRTKEAMEESEKAKVYLEKLVATASTHLNRVECLEQCMLSVEKKWNKKLQELSKTQLTAFGDILLSTAMVCFFGRLSPGAQRQLVNDWKSGLNRQDIPSTEFCKVADTMLMKPIEYDWIKASLPNDRSIIERMALAFQSNVAPLFIDPHGIISEWLIESYPDALRISDSHKTFRDSVARAMSEGHTLIYYLESNDRVHPVISSLLQVYRQSNESSEFVANAKVSISPTESVKIHKNFRFYALSDDRSLWSGQLFTDGTLSTMNPISFEYLSQDLMHSCIYNHILQHCDTSAYTRKKHFEHDIVEKECLLLLEETKCIKLLADTEGLIYEDGSRTDTILNLRKDMDEKVAQISSLKTKVQELIAEEEIRIGSKRLDKLLVVFEVMQDLRFVNPFYDFTLRNVAAAISNVLHSKTSFSAESFANILQHLQTAIFDEDLFAFRAILAIKLSISRSFSKLESIQLAYLFDGKQLSKPKFRQKSHDWLSGTSWNNFRVLEALFDDFEGVITSFQTHQSLWQPFFNSAAEDISACPLPPMISKLQRLCVVKATRPEAYLYDVMSLIDFSRPEALGMRSNLEESIRMCRNYWNPLLIVSEPGNDVIWSIKAIGDRMHEVTNVVYIQNTPKEEFVEKMTNAKRLGEWCVIILAHEESNCAWKNEANRLIFETINEESDAITHHKFRLWIVTESVRHLPRVITRNSVRVVLGSVTSGNVAAKLLCCEATNLLSTIIGENPHYQLMQLVNAVYKAYLKVVKTAGLFSKPLEFTPADLRFTLQELTKSSSEYVSSILKEDVYSSIAYDELDIRTVTNIIDEELILQSKTEATELRPKDQIRSLLKEYLEKHNTDEGNIEAFSNKVRRVLIQGSQQSKAQADALDEETLIWYKLPELRQLISTITNRISNSFKDCSSNEAALWHIDLLHAELKVHKDILVQIERYVARLETMPLIPLSGADDKAKLSKFVVQNINIETLLHAPLKNDSITLPRNIKDLQSRLGLIEKWGTDHSTPRTIPLQSLMVPQLVFALILQAFATEKKVSPSDVSLNFELAEESHGASGYILEGFCLTKALWDSEKKKAFLTKKAFIDLNPISLQVTPVLCSEKEESLVNNGVFDCGIYLKDTLLGKFLLPCESPNEFMIKGIKAVLNS